MRHSIPLMLASLGMLASSGARADFRADFSVVKGSHEHDLSRIELAGQHVRTDAGNVSVLFNAGSGQLLMLRHDRKSYMDMDQVAQTAGAAMARAKAALANLPPAQREMLEKRLGDRFQGMMGGNVKVDVTDTGKHRRVGKFSCDVYRTSLNGRRIQDACLADANETGISTADQATLRKAFEELKAFANKISAGMMKLPLGGMPSGKFPVRITHYDSDGSVRSTVQLEQLDRVAIDPGDFRIPAGYTQRTMGR